MNRTVLDINMSAATRRRLSYNPPNDAVSSSSSSCRRFSEDLHQRDFDKGVFQISGFTPFGKRSSQNVDIGNCHSLSMVSDNHNTMLKLRRSTTDVKSILKKQNSLGTIDYSYLMPLLASDIDSVSSKDKGDRDSSLSSSSSVTLCPVKAVKSSHNRRVRFNENVSFQEQGFVTYCETLQDDCATDFNENSYLESVPVQPIPHIFESTSEHVKHHLNKFKKNIRVEPVKMQKKLTKCCPDLGTIVSRPAWVNKSDQNEINTENSTTKPHKGHQVTQCHFRSLERAKTDLGPDKYKDVQSKLRRMGFFPSRRIMSSSKTNLSNRHARTKTRKELYFQEKLPDKDKTVYSMINENRLSCNYTTLREELYDIAHDDEALSVTYVTETCGEESLRSLGDQYARFLKGRYTLDDVTCS